MENDFGLASTQDHLESSDGFVPVLADVLLRAEGITDLGLATGPVRRFTRAELILEPGRAVGRHPPATPLC
jgi:hypothetical protein